MATTGALCLILQIQHALVHAKVRTARFVHYTRETEHASYLRITRERRKHREGHVLGKEKPQHECSNNQDAENDGDNGVRPLYADMGTTRSLLNRNEDTRMGIQATAKIPKKMKSQGERTILCSTPVPCCTYVRCVRAR